MKLHFLFFLKGYKGEEFRENHQKNHKGSTSVIQSHFFLCNFNLKFVCCKTDCFNKEQR